jgi:hypothetical protein
MRLPGLNALCCYVSFIHLTSPCLTHPPHLPHFTVQWALGRLLPGLPGVEWRLRLISLGLSTQHHPYLPTWVRGYGSHCIGHAAPLEHAAAHGGQGLDDVEVEPQALCLGAHDATGADCPVQSLEEGLQEGETVRWKATEVTRPFIRYKGPL